MRNQIHKFLLWIGPALFAGGMAIAGTVSAIAQGFPESRPWFVARYEEILGTVTFMTGPEIVVSVCVIVALWLAAFIWSGRSVAGAEHNTSSPIITHRMESDPIGDMFRIAANRPPKPLKSDTPLGSAAVYALYGRWASSPDETERMLRSDQAGINTTLLEMEQHAIEESLAIWGRDQPVDEDIDIWPALHIQVPADYWRDHWIDQGSLAGFAKTGMRPPHSDDGNRFYDLKVNRVQVERCFPPKPLEQLN